MIERRLDDRQKDWMNERMLDDWKKVVRLKESWVKKIKWWKEGRMIERRLNDWKSLMIERTFDDWK